MDFPSKEVRDIQCELDKEKAKRKTLKGWIIFFGLFLLFCWWNKSHPDSQPEDSPYYSDRVQ